MSKTKKPVNYLNNNKVFGEFSKKLEGLYLQDFKVYVFTTTSYNENYIRVYQKDICDYRSLEKWLFNADFVGFVDIAECPKTMINSLQEFKQSLSFSPSNKNFAAHFVRSNGIEMVDHWIVHPDAYHATKNVWLQLFIYVFFVVLLITWFIKCI